MSEAPLRQAAVLVPLLARGGAPHVLIVRRTEGGTHGGQLAFPGGVIEPGDASPFAAACREAEEEIGLPRASVVHLCDLPDVETRVTGFRIRPFLARIEPPAAWRPQEAEIAEVIEAPLAALADTGAHGWADDLLPGRTLPMRLPFIRVGGHRLWGASHRILHPLLPRLVAGEWEVAGPPAPGR